MANQVLLNEPKPTLLIIGWENDATVHGTVTLTDVKPSLLITGAQGNIGSVSLHEPLPVLAITGTVTFNGRGTVTLTERVAVLAIHGFSGNIGRVAITEPSGVLVISGYGAYTAAVALTEPLPTLRILGYIGDGQTYSTIAFHSERQAISTYSNFPFNSFAKFNGHYIGAGTSGLFELVGATDDGVAIDAVLRTGITDFGSPFMKSHSDVYMNYRTDGSMVVRVIVNDTTTYPYPVPTTSQPGLHSVRVPVDRGLIARNLQYEIANVNGASFSIGSLEVVPNILSRKAG